MEAILTTMVELPVSWFIYLLAISTILLVMGRIKLVVIINYIMIIHFGHLLNFSFFSEAVESSISGPVLMLAGFVIVNILLAAVCLHFHRE
jgi:hypothetical protein